MTDVAENLTPQAHQPISLKIAGADLLLNGRFDNWQTSLLRGADLDEAAVRLVVDVTSTNRQGPELFSYRSTKVKSVGGGVYEVEGVLDAPTGSHPLSVLVESPPVHTAFLALSFLARRTELGDSWHQLVDTAASGSNDPQELNAQAWVRTPVLAAA
jgi:hypothetical protein